MKYLDDITTQYQYETVDQDFPFKVCVRTFLATDFFCAAAPKEPLKKAMQQVANNNFFILIYRSKRLL